MARESIISQEQVNAAADALRSGGEKPTARSVRAHLGNRGSMGTIHRYLSAWRSGQGRVAEAALTLPPNLQRAMLEFLSQEISASRVALESELADARQEANDLAVENERQSEALENLQAEVEKLQSELLTARGRIGQLAADLDASKQEAQAQRDAAEAARTELAKAQLRLESMPRMESELARLSGELSEALKGRAEAERSSAVFSAQKADLEARLEEEKGRSGTAQAELDSLRGKYEELRNESFEAKAELRESRAKILSLETRPGPKKEAATKEEGAAAPAKRTAAKPAAKK